MEIPDDLKHLYKHWIKHTKKPMTSIHVDLDEETLLQMYTLIKERMKIWEKRQQNQKPPYANDTVLSTYRFCNVYRELDRQTIEIHTLLKDLEEDFELWLLNVIFCRMVCNPKTVMDVGLLSFDENNNRKVYKNLINHSKPKYGVAYIFPISLVTKVGLKTREEFFCFYLPKVTKQCVSLIKNFRDYSVIEGLEKILPVFGLNFKFHWTEILIDTAYQYPQYINLFKEFPIGPGSIPTMKKLSSTANPVKVAVFLTATVVPDFPYLTYDGKPVYLSAENWEGIGCEFRKYSNLVTGEGRKRIYRPR